MQAIYIVTGANGFLGNNIVRKLTQDSQNEVRALVSSQNRANALEGLNCKIYVGDVTRPETLEEIFDFPDNAEVYVIHCAAIVYIKSKFNPAVNQVNVNGTMNIAKKVLATKAKMVYVNSVHAIPELPNGEVMREISDFDPTKVEGQYAKSKAEAAHLILQAVRRHGLNACIVHPSGIIGPYDFKTTHLTQLIIDIMNGRLKAGVHGGYDFVDVRDVADGILASCKDGKAGDCFILSGHYVTIPELFQMVSKATGKKPIKTFLPLWLARITAPLSELYYNIKKQPPLYTRYSLYTLQSNADFSHEKATRELGYIARPTQETIDDTVKWLKTRMKQF